jgi:hypothetical protein
MTVLRKVLFKACQCHLRPGTRGPAGVTATEASRTARPPRQLIPVGFIGDLFCNLQARAQQAAPFVPPAKTSLTRATPKVASNQGFVVNISRSIESAIALYPSSCGWR